MVRSVNSYLPRNFKIFETYNSNFPTSLSEMDEQTDVLRMMFACCWRRSSNGDLGASKAIGLAENFLKLNQQN